MVFGQVGISHPSLAAMTDLIGNKLSREGLHYRFTKPAVRLLQKCLEFVLRQKLVACGLNCSELNGFKAVKILDSSSWDVHEKLKRILAGSGGSASQANCKVQTVYEYISGRLEFFKITRGTIPDQKYSAQIPTLVKAGELVIFDRGYFRVKTLSEIDTQGAYFLTRLVTSVNLFDSLDNPIYLQNLLGAHSGNTLEIPIVFKNSSVKLPCRLICLRVPEQVSEQRRRKLNAEAKKQGTTPSAKTMALCDWTLIITNTPEKLIPIEKALQFYALRWQIELIFKQFKSVLAIHHSNTSNHLRLLCEIYGKLIAATLLAQSHAIINNKLWNSSNQEVSFDKFFKRFRERAFKLTTILLLSTKKARKLCNTEFKKSARNCKKLYQKSRQTSLQKLVHAHA